MSEMVNGDLRPWVNDLVRSAQQARQSTVPPPSNAVFDAPSAPAFTGMAHAPFARRGATCSISLKVWASHATAGTWHPSRIAAPPPVKMGTTGKKSAVLRR